jgi:hypothetical protein
MSNKMDENNAKIDLIMSVAKEAGIDCVEFWRWLGGFHPRAATRKTLVKLAQEFKNRPSP